MAICSNVHSPNKRHAWGGWRRWARAPTIFCALLCASYAPLLEAKQYALLIGVSEYPALSQSLQLSGPKHDVAALRALLLKAGVADEDIFWLSEGGSPQQLPTRAAILARISQLAPRLGPEDRLLLYFAGHGAQAPARGSHSVSEPDGLDELFLPRDVRAWDGSVREVPNALRDDEIGSALQQLSSRGALIWAVMDSCHAGSMLRTADEDHLGTRPRWRGVSPAQLGAPLRKSLAARPLPSWSTHALPRVVAFLAAAPDQRTAEEVPEPTALLFPQGRASGAVASQRGAGQTPSPSIGTRSSGPSAQHRGVFTLALEQALLEHPKANFAELFAAIERRYQQQQRIAPKPMLIAPEALLAEPALP